MVELTPEQLKKLEQLARIEKNPTLEIINELSKVKAVLKKVKEKEVIIPEPKESVSISNPEDIKNDIIEAISQIGDIVEKYIAIKMDRDARKGIEMTKHTTEKEKSLDGLKNDIILAIQNLAENIPDINDYSDQLNQILDKLEKNKTDGIVKKLDELKKSISDNNFPEELTEYNRVKVILSKEQIKELGRSMSVSVSSGVGFPETSQADLKSVDNTLQDILANQGNINSATEETIQSIAGLNIPKHDTEELVYTDGVLTSIVYKLAGATVATETLIYTDGIFTGVTIL